MEGLDAILGSWDKFHARVAEFQAVWKDVESKQSLSLSAKKKLAEDTKAFKKLSESERLANIPDLLKSYQLEVDSISKRAKFSEAAFLELLKSVQETPPLHQVQEGIHAAYSSQDTFAFREQIRQKDVLIAKLREASHDLEVELNTVTNQAASVRRLEKQVKDLQAAAEANTADVKRQKDDEWNKRVDDMRREFGVQQEQHNRTLAPMSQQRESCQDELERLRTQRMEEQHLAEQAMLARTMEIDALSNDLERLQAELDRARLQHAAHSETQGSVMVLQSLLDGSQQRVSALERELADVRIQLAESREKKRAEDADHVDKEKNWADTMAAKDEEIQSLQNQLSECPSVDEVAALRQRLRDIDSVKATEMDATSATLENEQQKGVESQLAEMQMRTSELEAKSDNLQRKLDIANDEKKDLRQLVNRLENELGDAAGLKSRPPEGSLASLLPLDSLSDAPLANFQGSSNTSVNPTNQDSMPSMLAIVSGQRDRLRERVGDLEHERDRWKSIADQEKKRADSLHGDNVKLLEHKRYLQTFQPKRGGGKDRSELGRLVLSLIWRIATTLHMKMGSLPLAHLNIFAKMKEHVALPV